MIRLNCLLFQLPLLAMEASTLTEIVPGTTRGVEETEVDTGVIVMDVVVGVVVDTVKMADMVSDR